MEIVIRCIWFQSELKENRVFIGDVIKGLLKTIDFLKSHLNQIRGF